MQPRIGNRQTPNRFSPIVEFLIVALEFVKEFEKQPDRLWIILNNVHKEPPGVRKKINVLNPKLKDFVFEREKGRGPSAHDFIETILPCFKAIIRDLMGVGKR